MIDGVWVNVYLKKLPDDDYLFLIGTVADPKHLGQIYRKRWTIESFFQSLKGRGFDIESTHIKEAQKLKKLVAVVCIAFAVCISLGIYQDKKVKKIKIKKHGYKANSFCRVGIDLIKELCRKSVEVFEKAFQKFIRFLLIQKIKYEQQKLNNSLAAT
jgi:transposase